jgi:hypothetical protein
MLHLASTRLAGATSLASSRTTVDSRRRSAHCPTDLLHLVLDVFYYPAPIREQRTPSPFIIVITHRPHGYLCLLASEASRRDVPCAFFPKNVARAAIKAAHSTVGPVCFLAAQRFCWCPLTTLFASIHTSSSSMVKSKQTRVKYASAPDTAQCVSFLLALLHVC